MTSPRVPEILKNEPQSAQSNEKRLQTDPRYGIKNRENTEKIDEKRLWEEGRSFKTNAEKHVFSLKNIT